jgi:hypothetical protein
MAEKPGRQTRSSASHASAFDTQSSFKTQQSLSVNKEVRGHVDRGAPPRCLSSTASVNSHRLQNALRTTKKVQLPDKTPAIPTSSRFQHSFTSPLQPRHPSITQCQHRYSSPPPLLHEYR